MMSRSSASLSASPCAAREAAIPALVAEVERASLTLDTPAARLVARGRERPLLLEDVLNIIEEEEPDGVIVQFGGQTSINLAVPLARELSRRRSRTRGRGSERSPDG